MSILINEHEPAIVRGIKTVGIGKKGSQPLSRDLAEEILQALQTGIIPAISQGAFFAGLFLKKPTAEELIFKKFLGQDALADAQKLIQALAIDAPSLIQDICVKLLKGEELNTESAYKLGKFLLSNFPGDGARGIAVSALRVRYETADEYSGLLKSLNESIEPEFCQPPPAGAPFIQLAEPFDGIDHSNMITPLLANFLQKNYRVFILVGRNSGPKFFYNSLDLYQALSLKPIKNAAQLTGPQPKLGWYISQEDLSKPLNRWVDLRRQTIKRPFFSTLEKFLNPVNAQIIISSAFHPPYGEKMLTVAERAGFPAAIVVRNGIEGTLAFPLKRSAKILCSVRQKDGNYVRNEINFDPVAFLGFEVPIEEKLENPSVTENARLITEYIEKGKTGNDLFNHRVKVTCAGIEQAVKWVEGILNRS